MKISKKIKNAYEKLPVPDKEDVLPAAATEDAPKKRRFTPRLAYSLASLVLVASVVTAGAVGIVSRVGGRRHERGIPRRRDRRGSAPQTRRDRRLRNNRLALKGGKIR